MNNFTKQPRQSQIDADLPRWKKAYKDYFEHYGWTLNADEIGDRSINMQRLGVDHIVECGDGKLYFVDFMLREKPYANLFYEVREAQAKDVSVWER